MEGNGRIPLLDEEIVRLRDIMHKKIAIEQAGQQMAQHFTKMMEEAQGEFRDIFSDLRKQYGLDLESEQWDFSPETGELVLVSRVYNRSAR
jgi:hypothetical protein